MDITDKSKVITIHSEEIPEDRYAFMAYRLTCSAASYLMILSDDEENNICVTLLKRENGTESFIKRVKLPFDVESCIANGMAAALVQQLKVGRTYSKQYDQVILNAFNEIFYPTSFVHEQMTKLYDLISNENNFSVNIIQDIMKELVKNCSINYSQFIRSLAGGGSSVPLVAFIGNIMFQWNSFEKMLSIFADENTDRLEKDNVDMHIFMCGKIKFFSSFIQLETAESSTLNFSPENKGMIYDITSEIMKADASHKLYLTISSEDFDSLLLDTYYKTQGSKVYSMQPAMVKVYSDKMIRLSEMPVVYAGSLKGQRLPFNSNLIIKVPDSEEYILAPFDSDFSTLIALGKIKIEKMLLDKTEDGYIFNVEFFYQGRRYSPKPKEYYDTNIEELEKFPKIVIFQLNGSNNVNVFSVSEEIDTEVFNGRKNGESVSIAGPVRDLYFKLYCNNDYCGQIDYSFVKRRNLNEF